MTSDKSNIWGVEALICENREEAILSGAVSDVFSRILSLPQFKDQNSDRTATFKQVVSLSHESYIGPDAESRILDLLSDPSFIEKADKWIRAIIWRSRRGRMTGLLHEEMEELRALFLGTDGRLSSEGLIVAFRQRLNKRRVESYMAVMKTVKKAEGVLNREVMEAEKFDNTRVLFEREGYRFSLILRNGAYFLCDKSNIATPILVDISAVEQGRLPIDHKNDNKTDSYLVYSLPNEPGFYIAAMSGETLRETYDHIDTNPILVDSGLHLAIENKGKTNFISLPGREIILREGINGEINPFTRTSLKTDKIDTNICVIRMGDGHENILDINQSIKRKEPIYLLSAKRYKALRIHESYVFGIRIADGMRVMISLVDWKECIPEWTINEAKEKRKNFDYTDQGKYIKVGIHDSKETVGFILLQTGVFVPLKKGRSFSVLSDTLARCVDHGDVCEESIQDIVSLETGETLQEDVIGRLVGQYSLMIEGKPETVLLFEATKGKFTPVHPQIGVFGKMYDRVRDVGPVDQVCLIGSNKRFLWILWVPDAEEDINGLLAEKLANLGQEDDEVDTLDWIVWKM